MLLFFFQCSLLASLTALSNVFWLQMNCFRRSDFSAKLLLQYLLSDARLIFQIVYRPGYFTVHPPPAPSGPKFSNSENCCGSENAMPPKIFWDMEGHRGHFRSKNVFFFQKTYFGKNS